MCCCDKSNVNGTPGAYSWDGKTFMTYEPNPPALKEGDVLLYDEPGRCGSLDAHSHHFRLVNWYGYYTVLVRHGGGDERVGINKRLLPAFELFDSNGRYWLMHALYSMHCEAARSASDSRDAYWRKAAADNRIKVRKLRGQNMVKITVEPEKQSAPS